MPGTGNYRRATLRGKSGFSSLFSRNKSFREFGLSILSHRLKETDSTRVVVCVSKKSGGRGKLLNAVGRNRLKRITKESINDLIPGIKSGYYVAFFPSKDFEAMSFDKRMETARKVLTRAGLLESN